MWYTNGMNKQNTTGWLENMGVEIQAWAAVRALPFNLNTRLNRLGYILRGI